jgi:ABC-type sugar transport system ATPase subunit
LPLAERQQGWQAFVGRDVALGVRPEQVRVKPVEPGRAGVVDPRSPGLAQVRLVEKAGLFRLAILRYGDWTVTARLEGPATASEGTLAAVEFALVQAHLFDRETGNVLSSGRSE